MTETVFREMVGVGLPLVLTHGFGDTSSTWDAQWPRLARRCRALRWDLPGHGRSPRHDGPEAYSRNAALDHLDAMIRWVGGDAVLIGHSLGGYLSLCRAVTRPESVRGLVLLSTGPGYRNPEARERWNRGVRRIAKRFPVPRAATQLVEQHDDLVIANLARIRVPVLLLCGERDRAYHAGIELLRARLPDVRVHIVSGAGHHPHVSHAAEVQERIEAFLAGPLSEARGRGPAEHRATSGSGREGT